jgi:TetR/AcrR family transcriptional repressor of nem operon
VKVSRQEAAANRERIVEVASRLFRKNGFAGTSVADLMNGAGLTHGGFYGHFDSKDDLAAQACERALSRAAARWTALAEQEGGGDAFRALVRGYLAKDRVSSPGAGCVLAVLGPEAAREGKPVRRALSKGLDALLAVLRQVVPGRSRKEKTERSIAAMSEMVGAMVLARCADDPAVADDILRIVTADLQSRFAAS